jgi:hypothetical protein
MTAQFPSRQLHGPMALRVALAERITSRRSATLKIRQTSPSIFARAKKSLRCVLASRIENAELYVRAQTLVIELVAGSVAEKFGAPQADGFG